MSTKMMKFSSLAALALSVSLLTACGSESKEPTGFAPKTSQSSTTSTKNPTSKQTAKSASSSSFSSKSASASTTTSQKPSSSPAASSTPAASSQTDGSSGSTASSTDTASSSQTTTTESSSTGQSSSTTQSSRPKTRHGIPPVSPGVVAGHWSGIGKLNDDGTFEGSPVLIVGVSSQQSGAIYLDAITEGGAGFYMHYYPAGVKIPFEQFEDPTDSSRDRLVHGNGGYLNVPQDRFEDLVLDHIAYRE